MFISGSQSITRTHTKYEGQNRSQAGLFLPTLGNQAAKWEKIQVNILGLAAEGKKEYYLLTSR